MTGSLPFTPTNYFFKGRENKQWQTTYDLAIALISDCTNKTHCMYSGQTDAVPNSLSMHCDTCGHRPITNTQFGMVAALGQFHYIIIHQ